MKKRWKDVWLDNLSYKIVSLLIALILWLTILGRRDFTLTKSVDIEVLSRQNNVVITQNVEVAKVKVSGPRTALKKYMDSGLNQLVTLDVTDQPEGEVDIEIPISKIDVPFGVKIVSIKPSKVRARISPRN